jgi:signal transduction histidine kinase
MQSFDLKTNNASSESSCADPSPDLPGGASGLAHDLKSWLTPVRTCLQLWETGDREKAEALRPSALENLKAIMACLEQMRPGSRGGLTGLKAVPISGLLHHAVSLSLPLTQPKKLSVAVKVPAGVLVFADEMLLLRLLTNLLSNAAQAAPAGSGIELRAEPVADQPGWLRVSVSNSCTGDLEARAGVLNDAPQRWGIGLRICREIAALHGGQMDIQSTDTPPAITVAILLPGAS